MSQSNEHGVLYLVATPLGNLDDMVPRAVKVLQSVELIAAEDTRRTGLLLEQFGLRKPLLSLHEHNERDRVSVLIERLGAGQRVALVSDAGMPAISDPGYVLVAAVVAAGFKIEVIPGPCAAVTALAGSGLPTDRFTFLGFPPARQSARKSFYEEVRQLASTLVFYESVHRIHSSLLDACEVLGGQRRAVIARELTKLHETWYRGSLAELAIRAEQDADMRRGELVLLVEGPAEVQAPSAIDLHRLCGLLMAELPPGKAASLASSISGEKRRDCYQIIQQLQGRKGGPN